MSEINPGDVIRVSTDPGFTLDDAGETPTDPTTVTLSWYVRGEPPTVWTWTGSDNQIVRDDTGIFHADIPIARVGEFHFRWAGAGGVDAAEEGTFEATSEFWG